MQLLPFSDVLEVLEHAPSSVVTSCTECGNQPNLGEGPVNTINFARTLSNISWVQYVSPNVNVLYGNAWMNLAKGPLVLLIPPIPHRYYVMQFMDTFGQIFAYVGARATGSTGGTFLIAGPNWNGIVPNGMHEIKTPTNIAWISNRIFVNGTSDLPNVHAIQNQIKLVPLSVFQGNATSAAITKFDTIGNKSKRQDTKPCYDSCGRHQGIRRNKPSDGWQSTNLSST